MIMNFTMLGKTVPEPTNARLSHYVCSAGYSPEHGPVRLYPLGMQGTPRRWSTGLMPVHRHVANKDSRPESWLPDGAFGISGTMPPKDRRAVLEKFLVGGIAEANERRLSLAVMRPMKPRFVLVGNVGEDIEPSYNLFADGEALKANERFEYCPRLKFATEDGLSNLRPQVRDWGIWELMRKNHREIGAMEHADREKWVGNALHISEKTLLLMGNFANHRTSWMIISALNVG